MSISNNIYPKVEHVITSQPNKIKQLQQPEYAYDLQGQLGQQAHG
jgi:uncharacterized protein (UPF0333 family)